MLVLEHRQLIVITGPSRFRTERSIWLRDIHPMLKRTRKRPTGLVITLLVAGALFSWPVYAFSGVKGGDNALAALLMILPLGCLGAAIRVARAVEAFELIANDGSVVVTIYAPKGKKFACEDFVNACNAKMAERSG